MANANANANANDNANANANANANTYTGKICIGKYWSTSNPSFYRSNAESFDRVHVSDSNG